MNHGVRTTLKSRIEFITRHQTLFAADFELALDIVCNLGWLYEEGSFDERRLLVETLFERLCVRQDKIESYELNPPFAIFYDCWKDTEPGDKLVRFESLVAAEPGFEPGLEDPKSPVLPLHNSAVPWAGFSPPGAEGRSRTDTEVALQQFLRLSRLPFRHFGQNLNGAEDEIRTRDFLLGKEAFYR